MEITKCRCGGIPQFITKEICFGHGSYGKEYRLACECGLQTAPISDYDQSEAKCEEKCTKIWNGKGRLSNG